MAKQVGLHGIRGKVNGYSYYGSKNGGELMRKINEGMGERVKKDVAYANTRLNNAEFGGAGSFAGAIVRTITHRWRFILNSIATGDLVKVVKEGMMADPSGAWGFRSLSVGGVSAVIEKFNQQSKNQMPEIISQYLKSSFKYDPEDELVFNGSALNTTEEFCQPYIAKGADGFNLLLYAFSVSTPVRNNADDKYQTPVINIKNLDEFQQQDVPFSPGRPIIDSETSEECIFSLTLNQRSASGILAIMLPYKTVGTKNYVLQELCSAYWTSIEEGTAPQP